MERGGSGKKKRRHFGSTMERTSDATLRAINPIEFAEARAAEIDSMIDGLKSKGGAMRVHQTLPRHMRRRAMSHNSKRLPVRLREIASKEMANTLSPAEKSKLKKSRHNRRKPSNLKKHYESRAAKVQWLETHIWHAKRMHVRTEWGFKIPTTPCSKSVRATHRALKEACTIHDMSYTGCIELCGLTSDLISILDSCVLPKLDPESLGGRVELCCSIIVRPAGDTTSPGFLCPISIISEQKLDDNGTVQTDKSVERKLFIWVHPGAFSDAMRVFELSTVDTSVSCTARERDFIRFQLAGNGCQDVLSEVFMPVEADSDKWAAVSQISSAANLRRRAILSLSVIDPRLRSQQQRNRRKLDKTISITSPDAQFARSEIMKKWPDGFAVSGLWDPATRSSLLTSKLSDKILNDRRASLLIPGSDLPCEEEDARIPVMLVQRPGAMIPNRHYRDSCTRGYGSGWDLIAPAGWGMAFWVPLIHAGARVVGTNEVHSMTLERGICYFPEDYPDSPTGKLLAESRAMEMQASHDRRPPKHRVNFEKLKMKCPFQTDWSQIASPQANPEIRDWSVIRNLDRLAEFLEALRRKHEKGDLKDAFNGEFVSVQLTMTNKGTPKHLSWICEATEADQLVLQKNHDHPGPKLDTVTDRTLIGAISSARCSLVRGCGFGIGFISCTALLRSDMKFEPCPLPDIPGMEGMSFPVLVRDIVSTQCRFARAKICSGTTVFD